MIPPRSSGPEANWSLPGGGLHPHESLAECARREVLEETPEVPVSELQPEKLGAPVPEWVPLEKVPTLLLWPKELKSLCQRLQSGDAPEGTVSALGRLESPLALPEQDPFAEVTAEP